MHISEAELDEIWFSDTGNEEENVAKQRILMHCQGCPTCNDLLKSYLGTEREIGSLRHVSSQEGHKHCPEEVLWFKLLADVLHEKQAMLLLKHASECRNCAQHLSRAQMYAAEKVDEPPERESNAPAWQAMMARQMVASASRGKKESQARGMFFSWRLGATLAAAACMIVAVVVWFSREQGPQEVAKLLAQAYSENRTLELRIAHAQYGLMQVERGPRSQTSKPPALLQAEESVSRHLRKEFNDPTWLDLKGRADLLDSNYQAALKSLQVALQMQPNSTAILTDTATAYFEIAESEDLPQYYGNAIELLSKALAKSPDDPVALYNRAILREKMFLYHEAIADWQHYLQIDSKGEWAEEATRRLKVLQERVADHKKSYAAPLLNADSFLAKSGAAPDDREFVDERNEQYLDQAILEWLPSAFPQSSSQGEKDTASSTAAGNADASDDKASSLSSTTVQAIKALARILLIRHGDQWLSDLIQAVPSPRFAVALRALQQAVRANSVGDFATAKAKSRQAERLFHQAGNTAGEIRARYETVYALERSFQEKTRCLVAAAPLAGELQHHRYSWIQVQLYLEQSNCWSQIGNFGEARRYVENALAAGKKSHYPIIYLRAVGMAAALYSREGNLFEAYSLDRKGLAHYWEGTFPPIRAYQFYSDLDTLAEESAEWNFALALADEAVTTIELAQQPLGNAFAHHRLGKIALATGDTALAAQAFEQASSLFKALPQTQETWAYQADAEIELAKLQAERGDKGLAWIHLSAAGKHISEVSHYSIALSYYETLADLHQASGNSRQAIYALHSAVMAAEKGLGSLKNDGERLLWARETNKIYRDLAASKWRSHDVKGGLLVWELYRGAAMRNGRELQNWQPDGKPLDTRTEGLLRGSSMAGQTTLSFLQVADGLIVWVVNGHDITARWIGISQLDMDHLANSFRDQCANRNSDLVALRQNARALYDLLIAPMADRLPAGSKLVIEPDGDVAAVPMAALIDPEGRYLGETYTIVLSPGLLYQRHLRSSRRFSGGERALVVGSPSQDARMTLLDPVGNSAEEAKYVAERVQPATLLLGSQATLERVQRELGRASIFHFAGHGLTIHGKGGLLLAPSPRPGVSGSLPLLDTSSLASVKLDRLQLAVLSACATAGDGEDNLENAGNLVRLFLRAGVPHVVASHWNVDSGTTIDFMRTFYSQLQAGNSAPVSLQTAAGELRHVSITSHPYYWAAFTAFGY